MTRENQSWHFPPITKTKLIAEIGINHNGLFEVAHTLIQDAIEVGCDEIKFQYRKLPHERKNASELGEEMIHNEILRNYLKPTEIDRLRKIAQSADVKVGISFFAVEDCLDFNDSLQSFDFFKIPSASNLDSSLIEFLLKFKKPIYLSLGMLNHSDVQQLANTYKDYMEIIPFHCISNYPVKLFNSQISYINTLKSLWNRDIGYSSHDDNLLVIPAAIDLGISHLERHIAISKSELGLDKSSSSTKEEFRMIREYIDEGQRLKRAIKERRMNQGEVINRQNLSYSMYSRESYPKDSLVDSSMFYERSPCVGISKSEFHKYRGKKLLSPIEKDKPLTSGHFEILRKNTREEILEARNLMLSIPVRFHDIKLAYQTFDLDCYEFHLSFSDFESNYNLASIVREKFNYSLHVPDYISSNTLLDIFSNNNETKTRSRSLIDSSIKIAREVQEITGKTVPVVCSLNSSSYVPDFYKVVKEMQIEFEHEGVLFLPQWLPPVAWYFGGSYKIRYMNSLQAASEIKRNSIDICLDYSHLLLTCNFFDLNLVEIFEMLQMNSRHFHLAGAEGIDSEGTSVGALGEIESSVLSRILHQAGIKVLERWQGHLNDFSGFVNEISSLLALKQ